MVNAIQKIVGKLNADRTTLRQAAEAVEKGWRVPKTGEVVRLWKSDYEVGLGVYVLDVEDPETGMKADQLLGCIMPRQREDGGEWDDWQFRDAPATSAAEVDDAEGDA